VPNSSLRPVRSVLYMPANNAKAIDKARSLACDAVILDLEDAVAPTEKEAARKQAIAALQAGGFGHRQVIVRINGLDTPWGVADIAGLAGTAPDAVLVPKISSAQQVRRCDELMADLPPETRLWIMIETARAIFRLEEIADAAEGTQLAAFVMGTNDICKETNARMTSARAALVPQLSLAVSAARMAGLAIMDGVYNDLQDLDGLAAECRQGLELGFDGKTLIHPGQIAVANDAFSPTEAEIAFARAVITAFAAPENANVGVLRVDGKMVERLHLQQCERLVAIADIIACNSGAAA
jgi:citrate lyase subunit beta / citryl-CoA lyase